jgi:putative ABC transport system substrate-binding protein
MRRRDALCALFATAAMPLVAVGQAARSRPGGPFRIGYPFKLTPDARARIAAAFEKHGWRESRDYLVLDGDFGVGEGVDKSVRAMLTKQPDLVYVDYTAVALVAHRLTKSIPIVMMSSGYPVEAGLADSLSRPGRNVTGNTAYAGVGIWAKLIELLREAKPGIRRVGVLWSYVAPGFPPEELTPIETELAHGARKLGVTLHRVDVARSDQVGAALATMSAQDVEALLVTSGPALWATRPRVLEYAAERRLPAIVDWPSPPEAKGRRPLMTYAPSVDELRLQAVEYMVRILRDGAKPGELPIQQPRKFVFIVDLKAAREIGVKIPPSILLRADEVTE